MRQWNLERAGVGRPMHGDLVNAVGLVHHVADEARDVWWTPCGAVSVRVKQAWLGGAHPATVPTCLTCVAVRGR